jgi:predicted O-linked N-acetylglucosamine transferase (SPINDLY family)
MGAEWVDYIIGDPFTTALDQQPFFDEKIVQLPDCLMTAFASGDQKTIPDRPSQGLPEKALVFCCFNPARTISPDCFAIWMNILKNVPGSILWLLDDNEAATANLKRSAAALGVDPARLLFAPRAAGPDHLARLPLADLYLDTMPSSSAAAVAQALAAGVPVLACAGETMVSRISGSILKTCGLTDMITYAPEHYDHVARLLTCNPRSLKELRARLAGNMKTARFFDVSRYQSALDAAFEHMVAIARNGEWPYAFAVALDDERVQKRQTGRVDASADDDDLLLLAEADAV